MASTTVDESTSANEIPIGPRANPNPAWQAVRRFLSPIASLRLTVALFVLSILLVFFGTLAQVDESLHTVLERYFRSLFVWVPYQLLVLFGQKFFEDWVPASATVGGSFPFPGGWLLGGLMLANLLAAHVVRFRFSWKRSGILILHAGLIVMMVSELITGLYAVESKVTVAVGETVSFADISHLPIFHDSADTFELAFTTSKDGDTDAVVVVPGSILRRQKTISDPLLPVDIEVLQFMPNSTLLDGAGGPHDVTSSDGKTFRVEERPNVSGVDTEQREDAVSARIRLTEKATGKDLGAFMTSLWFEPNFTLRQIMIPAQKVIVDGKTYTVELRRKREYQPFNLELLEFRHDKYMGTNKAKNFSSRVRLTDPRRGEDREVLIYMNHPLRYDGMTFYQSGYFPRNDGTVLQVVRNPGWLMPYVSCAMVTLGMLVHFLLHLQGFLKRRALA
jgi:hypothetical protein